MMPWTPPYTSVKWIKDLSLLETRKQRLGSLAFHITESSCMNIDSNHARSHDQFLHAGGPYIRGPLRIPTETAVFTHRHVELGNDRMGLNRSKQGIEWTPHH